MNDVWKDIPGYDGYQATTDGRIRAIDRVCSSGKKRHGRVLKQKTHDGYQYINFHRVPVAVHRLVALAFIPNPESKKCINHKDLNRANNNVDNLEWCTHSENAKHALAHGRLIHLQRGHDFVRGEKNNNAKLSDELVRNLRSKISTWVEAKQYARNNGLSPSSVWRAITKKTWAHVAIAVLLLPTLYGCPSKDFPPPFDIICTGDGYGGSNCSLKDGSRKKLLPSEMKNMWCTTQDDIAKFSAWAYGVSSNEVEQRLSEMRQKMQRPMPGPVAPPQLREPAATEDAPAMPIPYPQTGEPYDPNKTL